MYIKGEGGWAAAVAFVTLGVTAFQGSTCYDESHRYEQCRTMKK